MDLLSIETVKSLLSEAGKIKLSENLLITTIVLWVVRGHFKTIEAKLQGLADSLISLEKKSGERMTIFEIRLTKLEKPGEG